MCFAIALLSTAWVAVGPASDGSIQLVFLGADQVPSPIPTYFWFVDVIVSDAPWFNPVGFQVTLDISGPPPVGDNLDLDFVPFVSEIYTFKDPEYWLFENSLGLTMVDLDGNSLQVGDSTANGLPAVISNDDRLAKFVFVTHYPGMYTIDVDNSDLHTFFLDEHFSKHGIDVSVDPLHVAVPEPGSLSVLLAASALVLIRRRRCMKRRPMRHGPV